MQTNTDRLMLAIAQQEGYGRTGKVPTRLNNPGDLMFAHQANAKPHAITGADGKVRTYAEFAKIEDGFAALRRQIYLDRERGLTLAEFVRKYAPASDGNNPSAYMKFLMGELGVDNPDAKLADVIPEYA